MANTAKSCKAARKTPPKRRLQLLHTALPSPPPRKSNNCASRLFFGTNCAWETNTGTYSDDDQGFIVRVAQDDCVGHQCPGVICEAKITQARPDNIFTLHCGENGEGIVGDRVSIQLPGSSRMLNFNELEVFGDAGEFEAPEVRWR
jgi:hypothetical protein